MSGTSADGIDAALVRLSGSGWRRRFDLLAFESYPYVQREREAILAACNSPAMAVANLSRLNTWMGRKLGGAAVRLCKRVRVPLANVDFIASHGQTIYHQPGATAFLGSAVRCTWQIGEPAEIAALTGCRVVSDFRVADVAAGGQGAPLVPFLDYLLLCSPTQNRAALNIGGIANVTLIPAACAPEEVFAFDTGPGNMVIDALASHFSKGKLRQDQDGAWAASGKVLQPILRRWLADAYYRRRPPKSAGREQYGREFLMRVLRDCKGHESRDVMATVTALTAHTVARALRDRPWRVYVSGGGVHNLALMNMLSAAAPHCAFLESGAAGLPADGKEAIAFAVLGHAFLLCEPAGLPSVTGAKQSAILGKLSLPPLPAGSATRRR